MDAVENAMMRIWGPVGMVVRVQMCQSVDVIPSSITRILRQLIHQRQLQRSSRLIKLSIQSRIIGLDSDHGKKIQLQKTL